MDLGKSSFSCVNTSFCGSRVGILWVYRSYFAALKCNLLGLKISFGGLKTSFYCSKDVVLWVCRHNCIDLRL